ncbi:MAG: thioredoxin domain-containing protein, partial [Gemmatimonadota bacterium]|nr:thioredoxin domain-containing protein [Gemmatimonadota bacterium]
MNSLPPKPHPRNRLAGETSPYLLQHAANPVDWYPWGPEALDRARAEDKPILLSIGYAACHWCHVMAHESFESEETAALMNEHFVNIKVDREERPDIDSIYMQAVQAMSGHGGWPMTMFLLPDGAPFYGGTYFPPEDRHGLPSFRRLLVSVADAYRDKRENVSQTAAQIATALRSAAATEPGAAAPDKRTLELAYRGLARSYDVEHSGFGTAPKFPPTMALDFLLRHWRRTGEKYALEMTIESFRAMVRGGIYDQIGGGMARYSVDAAWLVPHFEKMLYDNALLIRLGSNLWQATKDDEVRIATARSIEWVKREMTSPESGFYSSLDADSEGHEGLFYLWTESELDTLLGDDAALVKSFYGVSPAGNFEGKNILFVGDAPGVTASRSGIGIDEMHSRLECAQSVLYEARAKRVWPGLDDKILAGWNGLMLRGVASAARVFDRT